MLCMFSSIRNGDRVRLRNWFKHSPPLTYFVFQASDDGTTAKIVTDLRNGRPEQAREVPVDQLVRVG